LIGDRRRAASIACVVVVLCALIAATDAFGANVFGLIVLTVVQGYLIYQGKARQGTFFHPCAIVGVLIAVYGWLGFIFYPLIAAHGLTPLKGAMHESFLTLVVFETFSAPFLLVAWIAPRPTGETGILKVDLGKQTPAIRAAAITLLAVTAAACVIGADDDLHERFLLG